MSKRQRIGLLALFCGVILLNYPLVNVVNEPRIIAGIPQVFLYVFCLWLLIIGIAYLISLDEHGTR